MGTANGISQSFVALVRFASYASFGLIYGWSVSDGSSVPGIDATFSYFSITIILVVDIILIRFTLDKSIEKKKVAEIEKPLIEKN